MKLKLTMKIDGSYVSLWRDSWMDWEELPPHRRWPVIWFILAHGAVLGALLILFMAWLDSIVVGP